MKDPLQDPEPPWDGDLKDAEGIEPRSDVKMFQGPNRCTVCWTIRSRVEQCRGLDHWWLAGAKEPELSRASEIVIFEDFEGEQFSSSSQISRGVWDQMSRQATTSVHAKLYNASVTQIRQRDRVRSRSSVWYGIIDGLLPLVG